MLSDLAGDSMRLSGSESPTVNPFRLDAIICAGREKQLESVKSQNLVHSLIVTNSKEF